MEENEEQRWETIVYTAKEGIATILLNRPRSLNALDRQMFLELRKALRRAAALAKRNLYKELSLDIRSALEVEAAAQKECLSSNGLPKDPALTKKGTDE